MSNKVYIDIEKDINQNKNNFENSVKDVFWRFLYFLKRRTFLFNGAEYNYFYHPYNKTWRNERAIEIPILIKIYNDIKEKNVLEVGNVLSHYIKTAHDIVDKYEIGKGIINIDIVDYLPHKKYDIIISISTIEHIGWDENPRDDQKIIRAIEHMIQLLATNGSIYITFPLGYNFVLEKLINDGKINFKESYYLKRIPPKEKKYFDFLFKSPSYNNTWIQVEKSETKDVKYGSPFPHANAIFIGKIIKSSE